MGSRADGMWGQYVVSEINAAAVWGEACKHLQSILHPDVYARWIAVIQPDRFDGEALTLHVECDFYQTWLEENYLPIIRQAVQTVCGTEIDIRFSVATPPAGAPRRASAQETPVSTPARQRTPARTVGTEPAQNRKFTFDEFVVGPSNSFAHAACMAVAQSPARAYNPLFIYGGVGLGKTHLMQAIGNYVLSQGKNRVCYVSSEAFTNEYIDSLQNRKSVQFRKKYRSVDLLLIDDIHFLAGKERLQEEFFHTFNALFDAHKQIVMTSDCPASAINGLEQRLVSRFEWGLVTELQAPDFETRIAILRNRQADAALKLPDEIITFIARNIKSNIRRLEGALIRATSYASLTGSPLTTDRLEVLLRDTLEQEQHESISFDSVQRAVAEYYDVRLADMTSKRRPQAIAMPRQVAMYLCRQLTSASLPEIANAFGKTHATVLHACRQVSKRMDADSALKQCVADLSKKLGRVAS